MKYQVTLPVYYLTVQVEATDKQEAIIKAKNKACRELVREIDDLHIMARPMMLTVE
jgi:hypothetical protein